jgi:hypothetical protein
MQFLGEFIFRVFFWLIIQQKLLIASIMADFLA